MIDKFKQIINRTQYLTHVHPENFWKKMKELLNDAWINIDETDEGVSLNEKIEFAKTFTQIMFKASENAILNEQHKILCLTALKGFCTHQLADYLEPSFKQSQLQQIENALHKIGFPQPTVSVLSTAVLHTPVVAKDSSSSSTEISKENICRFTGSLYNHVSSLLNQANTAKSNGNNESEKTLLTHAELLHKEAKTLNSQKFGLLENLAIVSWNLMIGYLEHADNSQGGQDYLDHLKMAQNYCEQAQTAYKQALLWKKDHFKRPKLQDQINNATKMLHIIENTIETEISNQSVGNKKIKMSK